MPLGGTPPVSTAFTTMDWKLGGIPRRFSLLIDQRSCALTSAPSTATPATAPISRLVLAADAAMPERSGGTAPSTDEVIGTTVQPMPAPVRASAPASGTNDGCGLSTALVSSSPAAKAKQPALIDQRSPAVLSYLPASTDDVIISIVMGKNASAIRNPE